MGSKAPMPALSGPPGFRDRGEPSGEGSLETAIEPVPSATSAPSNGFELLVVGLYETWSRVPRHFAFRPGVTEPGTIDTSVSGG